VLSAFGAGRAAGHFRQLEVHAFGGVANTLSRGATAYVHRDALFCVNYRDTIADPAVADTAGRSAAQSWVDSGFGTIDPYSSGESYQNWIDPDLPDWKQAYYAENYPRLVRVKRAYDPSSFFTFNQGIGS
jgi:FAD/FMN-containing dehydrogenase